MLQGASTVCKALTCKWAMMIVVLDWDSGGVDGVQGSRAAPSDDVYRVGRQTSPTT